MFSIIHLIPLGGFNLPTVIRFLYHHYVTLTGLDPNGFLHSTSLHMQGMPFLITSASAVFPQGA